MVRTRCQRETAESIMKFWCDKYPSTVLHTAIDRFGDVCEKYRNCPDKDKLTVVAELFIYACNVMRCDFLTGSQALEVANSCATDLGLPKTKIKTRINWLMFKKRTQK